MTDFATSKDGSTLNFNRVYNSKSTKLDGIFGAKWGSPLETHLEVTVNRSVVVHEFGNGLKKEYRDSDSDVKVIVSKLVAELKKQGKAISKKLMKDLEKNADLRNEYAKKYSVMPGKIATGVRFYLSNGSTREWVQRTKSGYKRVGPVKDDYFTSSGLLTKSNYHNGYSFTIHRSKSGMIEKVVDSTRNMFFFTFNSDGHVKCIIMSKLKSCYEYKGNDLVGHTDFKGRIYVLKYDWKSYLTEIVYGKQKMITVAYDAKTRFATKVIDHLDGKVETMEYGDTGRSKMKYWTEYTTNTKEGIPIHEKVVYEYKKDKHGRRYIYKESSTAGDSKTQVTFNKMSLPIKITVGGKSTTFEYNDYGQLLVKKMHDGRAIKFQYNKQNRMSRIEHSKGHVINYTYHKNGQMKQATHSDGRKITLHYDKDVKTRLVKAIEDNKQRGKNMFTFAYDDFNKIKEVAVSNLGKIEVSSVPGGVLEFKKIHATKNAKKLKQVVSLGLTNISELKNPADTKISFN